MCHDILEDKQRENDQRGKDASSLSLCTVFHIVDEENMSTDELDFADNTSDSSEIMAQETIGNYDSFVLLFFSFF